MADGWTPPEYMHKAKTSDTSFLNEKKRITGKDIKKKKRKIEKHKKKQIINSNVYNSKKKIKNNKISKTTKNISSSTSQQSQYSTQTALESLANDYVSSDSEYNDFQQESQIQQQMECITEETKSESDNETEMETKERVDNKENNDNEPNIETNVYTQTQSQNTIIINDKQDNASKQVDSFQDIESKHDNKLETKIQSEQIRNNKEDLTINNYTETQPQNTMMDENQSNETIYIKQDHLFKQQIDSFPDAISEVDVPPKENDNELESKMQSEQTENNKADSTQNIDTKTEPENAMMTEIQSNEAINMKEENGSQQQIDGIPANENELETKIQSEYKDMTIELNSETDEMLQPLIISPKLTQSTNNIISMESVMSVELDETSLFTILKTLDYTKLDKDGTGKISCHYFRYYFKNKIKKKIRDRDVLKIFQNINKQQNESMYITIEQYKNWRNELTKYLLGRILENKLIIHKHMSSSNMMKHYIDQTSLLSFLKTMNIKDINDDNGFVKLFDFGVYFQRNYNNFKEIVNNDTLKKIYYDIDPHHDGRITNEQYIAWSKKVTQTHLDHVLSIKLPQKQNMENGHRKFLSL